MIDSLLMLTAWTAVPLLMALVSWARERHVSRFPDCPVCMAQNMRSDAQNAPSEPCAETREGNLCTGLYVSLRDVHSLTALR